MRKDVGWKSFFEDNRRYADVINGVGCDGKTPHRKEKQGIYFVERLLE